MDGVGVGQQQKAVAFSQAFEEAFRDQGFGDKDAAPHPAEVGVVDLDVEDAAELFDKIFGGDLAGFEADDEVGRADVWGCPRRGRGTVRPWPGSRA